MPDQSPCKSCGKPVLWVRSATTGNLMPIDAIPSEDGNIALINGEAVVFGGSLFEPMLPAGPRHKSHFATCSDPELYRRKKAKKGE